MAVPGFRRIAITALMTATFSAQAGTAFLIEIADTGAYRITHEQLQGIAPELGEIPSDRLTLSSHGQARRLHIHDGGDGRFGPGDSVSFYGERLHGKQSWYDTYAVNNVYRLQIADTAANRSEPALASTEATEGGATEPGLRRHLHLEEENLQIRLSNRWVQPDEEPDLWHWAKLTQIDPEPFTAPFALPDLASRGTVRITVGLRGLSDIRVPKGQEKPHDHTVEVVLNDQLPRVARFETRNEYTLVIETPAEQLRETGNTLRLHVPKRMLPGKQDALVDVVMFDYVNIDYPIAGDLDTTPLPISIGTRRASTNDTTAITLKADDAQALTLYGRDGSRQAGIKQGDSWRFLVTAGDYQPVMDDGYSSPSRLRLAPPMRWRDVAEGYDYLMIGHSTLLPEARALAEHHRQNGLRVAEIDVADLYDEFNHGVVHPKAIRNFIAHAYHEWPAPRPRFVLLVGDASFDIRSDRAEDRRYAKWADRELLFPGQFGEIPGGQYENTDKIAAKRNLIPTWQYPSEEGHSAADNYFVAVDGDDWMPDLALGRFPVVEPSEVAAIVKKTIGYANNTDFGEWRRRALFTTDTSTYFQRESTRIAGTLEAEGFEASEVYAYKEETDNEKQINSLNQALNEGQLLVHFIGHGGRYIWRTGPPDLTRNHDLFTLDHVADLQNGDRLPMVLSMTCYSAPFDHPNADSIGERFLREADRGAIAVFAASWRNTPTPKFSEAAVTELMTPGATIGEALMRAKQTLNEKWHRTLVETYNLLGDPAVVLQRPSLPLRLEARDHGSESLLDVLSPDTDVNGRAQVEWRDENGEVLARRWREIRGNRGTFVVPPEALAAYEVQAHLVDYRTRRDGVARLALNVDVDAESQGEQAAAVAAEPPAPSLVRPIDEESIGKPPATLPDAPVSDRITRGSMEPQKG